MSIIKTKLRKNERICGISFDHCKYSTFYDELGDIYPICKKGYTNIDDCPYYPKAKDKQILFDNAPKAPCGMATWYRHDYCDHMGFRQISQSAGWSICLKGYKSISECPYYNKIVKKIKAIKGEQNELKKGELSGGNK